MSLTLRITASANSIWAGYRNVREDLYKLITSSKENPAKHMYVRTHAHKTFQFNCRGTGKGKKSVNSNNSD